MAQGTRQDINRGRYQGTSQEARTGRRSTGARLNKTQFQGRDDTEKLVYLYEEVSSLWDNLQGRGSDKKTRNPRMRISQFLDQQGRINGIWDGEKVLPGTELGEQHESDQKWYLAAQDYSYDDRGSVIAPAVWQSGLGSSNISGWEIPTGTTSLWFWHNLPLREAWRGSGAKISSTLWYGLSSTPSIGDTIAVWSSGWGYNHNQDLTSPTTQWNEGDAGIVVAGKVPSYIYSHTWTEPTSTLTAVDYISHRLTFARANAGYTYGGSVYLYGMQLEIYE